MSVKFCSAFIAPTLFAGIMIANLPAAHAQLSYYVRAVAGTTLNGQDTGYVANGPTQLTATATQSTNGTEALSIATARLGSLSAYSRSSAPARTPQQFVTGINGLASGEFSDYITFNGPTGGSLLVTFGVDLSGSFINDLPGIRTGASASTYVQVQGGGVNQIVSLNWNSTDPGPTGTSTITARIPYNTAIRVLGGLSVNVGTVGGTGANVAYTAEADFSHTAKYYVTPAEATPPANPFSFSSFGGGSYALASVSAPEPGSFPLLGIAALATSGVVCGRIRLRGNARKCGQGNQA